MTGLVRWLTLAVFVTASASALRGGLPADSARLGLPGEAFGRLTLPLDDRMHPDADNEWWYFTGHLESTDGMRYGYEFTLFKFSNQPFRIGPFPLPTVYRLDFAVTSETEGRFFSKVSTLLPLPTYHLDSRHLYARFGSTLLAAVGPFTYRLRTTAGRYGLDLFLQATKAPLAQGDAGWIAMGAAGGSYYYSLTRLRTQGRLTADGVTKQVSGLSWMDHQWGNWDWRGMRGWDWMGIQLDDGTDVMVFAFHAGGGRLASVYGQDGDVIKTHTFSLDALGSWNSPATGATYPAGWRLAIPEAQAVLNLNPTLPNQEMVDTMYPEGSYWEGSCTVEGTLQGRPVRGMAYVELVGYVPSPRLRRSAGASL